MRRAIAALVVGVSLPFAGATQEQPLLLFQAAVTPERTVWVGQRVTLTLTALTPVRFAAPPAFPDLAGLPHLVVLPEATTVPGTIRVGSASYAALERGVAIFPTEAGEFALPSLSLSRPRSADWMASPCRRRPRRRGLPSASGFPLAWRTSRASSSRRLSA
jgi:hypothetical protein